MLRGEEEAREGEEPQGATMRGEPDKEGGWREDITLWP